MLKRHEVQVLLKAGLPLKQISEITGLPERSIRRIKHEPEVVSVDEVAPREERKIGRPSKAAPFKDKVEALLEEEPHLKSVEILRRMRIEGYEGGKSAMYELVRGLRKKHQDTIVRFEGLPGEFSQHDFGEVNVTYLDGTTERIQFFGSRMKYSRFVQVTVVDDQKAETLVRCLCDHFQVIGGVPLLAVFDRPKTIAKKSKANGEVVEWNSFFAQAALELRMGIEMCWPRQPRQKGSVENLVKWVKGSFFKQRRFKDRDDLLDQLDQWHIEVNFERECRATERIPAELLEEERPRLRPVHVTSETLGLPVPIHVGPTAVVIHDTHKYSMPPESAGFSGTLYLYPKTVKIVAGRYTAEHPRLFERHATSRPTEHRAARLATVSGKRGRDYLKREDILELGDVACEFVTELVHRRPKGWKREIDQIWDALQAFGADPLRFAMYMACAERRFSAQAVLEHLSAGGPKEVA